MRVRAREDDLTPQPPSLRRKGEPVALAGEAGGSGGARGEDRSSKIRNGHLRGAILRILAMLSRHALSGSARWGVWRLPTRRIGRAGGAPGLRGREKRSRRP